MTSLTAIPAATPLGFIDRFIAEIELTPTQYENAKTSYEAVASVLNANGSLIVQLLPRIRPQGSMRIGTTIRPWGSDEFDLDMLCWLAVSGKLYTPEDVYNWVWNTLYANGTYRPKLEKRCRCIRIKYNDSFKFHLDITPAIPDWNRQSDSLYIPDRTRKVWCSTHPLGFADSFFKPIAQKMPMIVRELTENARGEFSAKSATTEPLPDHGAFDKTPLQRIVQLIKHDRDKHFENKPNTRPSSVLLTTLVARSYESAVHGAAESLMAFVLRVVAGIPTYISKSSTGYIVKNPVNDQENFAEAWTDAHFSEFMRWHGGLVGMLRKLEATRGKGVDVLLNEFSANFGKDTTVRIANAVGLETRKLHESRNLHMDTAGKVAAVGTVIPKTVNFGA